MKVIKEIRALFTYFYAKHCYKKMRKEADRLHQCNKCHYYICIDPRNENRCVILNRKAFRNYKRQFNDIGMRLSVFGRGFENNSTMTDVQDGCFYGTIHNDISNDYRKEQYIKWVMGVNYP